MSDTSEDLSYKLLTEGEKIISSILEFIERKPSFRNISRLELEYKGLYSVFAVYVTAVNKMVHKFSTAKEFTDTQTKQQKNVNLSVRIYFFIFCSGLNSQKDYCSNLFKEARNQLDRYHSKVHDRFNLLVSIVAICIALASLYFSFKQAKDTKGQVDTLASIARIASEAQQSTRDAVSEELTISLDTRLSDKQNTAILESIDKHQNPVKLFSEYEVDNYLAVYETLDAAYRKKLVSDNDFCNMFSDGVLNTYENKDIQAYIQKNQVKNQKYYTGFQHLASVAYEICD